VRFGLTIAALFAAFTCYDRFYDPKHDPIVFEGRSFFGLVRVRETAAKTEAEIERAWIPLPGLYKNHEPPKEWKIYRELVHGGINHGRQIVRFKKADEQGKETPETEEMNLLKRREPITYFHQRNGVAEVFYKLCWPTAEPLMAVTNMTGQSDARMPASMFGLAMGHSPALALLGNTQSEPPYAVIGLGTGILACYAKPFQRADFFEIDPLVKSLSVVPGYSPPWERSEKPLNLKEPTFTFVHDAQERWANVSIVLGDGRLTIKEAPKHYYHVIVLDAFSSDAIPVHLLTKQAIELYLDKLADGGVILFNTTNRYVRLEGVLAAIANELDLDCLRCPDPTDDATDHPDRYGADWVVLQRKSARSGYLNGGRPIGERLEAKRDRLRWNGTPVGDDEGKTIVEDRWREVTPLPGPVWTDSYSNLLNPRVLRLFRWKS
jgi:hypothetical protein